MPDALIRKLKGQAAKSGADDTNAYVFGTLRKLGWKPRREGGDDQLHPKSPANPSKEKSK